MKVKVTGGVSVLVAILMAAYLSAHTPSTFATPACPAGAAKVTTATALRSKVAAAENACVTADVGDVNLDNLASDDAVRTIGTQGNGRLGAISLRGSSRITLRARFRSIRIDNANHVVIDNSVIGGTREERTGDQLVFIPSSCADCEITNNDIGWTTAGTSGNNGYGLRIYGVLDRALIQGNRIHDIAADGIQGVGGEDVLIDRNEIGPVGANPESSEHSDSIQITGNGPNLRITNNWLHHQGYFGGQEAGNSGIPYIHGGTENALLFENNLVEIGRGRAEVCGLGTGGTGRSNITIRQNTFYDLGQSFSTFPGFEWDCDTGTGNTVERNIAVDPDGGFALNGSAGAVTLTDNLFGRPGLVTLSESGNCSSANCTTAGDDPVGYRKPTGVHW